MHRGCTHILRPRKFCFLFVSEKGGGGGHKRQKGPVKLIKQVKIADSFLQSVSNQFHVIILSLPM